MNGAFRTIVRWGLGAMFLVAGATKLLHPADFFSDLLSYRVPFPQDFLRMVAVGLPWLEVFSGLGLIINFWPETIRPLVCSLWLIFVLMLGQALVRGLDLNCGCFGAVGRGWFERPDVAFARAIILFAASLWIAAVPVTGDDEAKPGAQKPPGMAGR